MTPFVTISLSENTYFWFDTYGIRSDYEATSDVMKNPTQIDFTVDNEWESIKLPQLVFTIKSDSERKTGRYFDNVKLFNSFTLHITSHFNYRYDTKIADIIIDACHKLYCSEADGFPATNQGQTSSIRCAAGYKGTQTRVCPSTRYPEWERVQNSTCEDDVPTNFRYPSSIHFFYKGETMTAILRPTFISISSVDFTSLPALPNGLNLDKASGEISGTPKVKAATAIYTINARNKRGVTQTTIQITVGAYECPGEAYWPATEKGSTSSIECVGGHSGTRTRECRSTGDKTGRWLAPNEGSCKKIRDWNDPNKGEVYYTTALTVDHTKTLDDIFLDYLRKALNDAVPGASPNSVYLALQTGILVDLRIVSTIEAVEAVESALNNLFNTGTVLSYIPESYSVQSIRQGKPSIKNYNPKSGASILAIVLSSVFGGLLLIFIGLCFFYRFRSRRNKKTARNIRIATASSGGLSIRTGGANTTGSKGASARSQKSVRL